MAQIYTDECENNIVKDCNNLLIVLRNLGTPSPKNDAESLKYLYNVSTLTSYKQTSKLFQISQFAVRYLCNHPKLPSTLVEIIRNSRNLKITTYALDILFLLIIKNKLVPENERRTIRKLFWDPQNFKNILECLQNTYFHYKENNTFVFNEILLKILKIINCLYMRKGSSQISSTSNFTIQFIGDLVDEYRLQREIFQVLLPVVRTLSRNKKNIPFLISEQFFNYLALLLPTISKLATVISILKLMIRCADAVQLMSKCERIYSFILNTISTPGNKVIYKKHLITVLYKLTKTAYGIQIISKPLYWNILLDFLSKNDKQDDQKFRLILIKVYTILYRGVNKILYDIKPIHLKLNLPVECQIDSLEHSDESDNEIDDSEDEDENNNITHREKSLEKMYTSEEDCDDTEEDDTDDQYDVRDVYHDNHDKPHKEDLSYIRKFFQELFPYEHKEEKLKIYEGVKELLNYNEGNMSALPKIVENRVKRHESMNNLAFPDVVGATDETDEYITPIINCLSTDNIVKRLRTAKGFEADFPKKIIYNLDELLKDPICSRADLPNPDTFKEELHKSDFKTSTRVVPRYKMKYSKYTRTLSFESRFESGNMRMAEQIGDSEYNLFLTPDVSVRGGLQWFYFQVSDMTADVIYTFNIINFQKVNSQFNYGMQPVIFSCMDFVINGTGWRKIGENVLYHGNGFKNSNDKQYRTLSFTLSFPHNDDYCYLAYHYPYTYSKLMMKLYPFNVSNKEIIYSRLDKLCTTVNGSNDVPLVTITAPVNDKGSTHVPLENRPLIFLTARVHPSESNSSWVMDGILDFLLDESDRRAFAAREKYIFKIIPMLNPEGVIFGNTRCGITGNDLNRCWKKPNRILHPEIFCAKKLVQFAKEELKNKILTFIDIHGHSRKKFFFLYGCNPKQSWNDNDRSDDSSDNSYLLIPRLLSTNVNMKQGFCRYTIERKRESTCRVVMWREFDIKCSYTLECSYCSGENKKKMTTKMLRDIGISIITSLASLPQLTDGK